MRNESVECNEEAFDEKEDFTIKNKKNKGNDGGNIALLFFLYLLQGIPLGLSAAIPLILQKKNVSYKDQVNILF